VEIPSGTTYAPVIAASGAVCLNMTIDAGATMSMGSGGCTIYGALVNNGTLNGGSNTVNIAGDWTNNGTFNYQTSTINFNGTNALQTINGTAATTGFYNLGVTKGSQSNVLEVKSVITLNSTVSSSGPLKITSGTFKLSSASTITPFSWPTLGSSVGFWNNGGTVTISGCYLASALFRNTAGTSNVGFLMVYGSATPIKIEGGTVNITSSFSPYQSNTSYTVTYAQTGGNIVINSASSSIPFYLASGSTFNMSGGNIIIQNASGATAEYQNLASTYNVTGGTLQIGNASTSGSPTVKINSTAPVYNLVVNSTGTPTAKLLTNNLIVNNNVTLGSATNLDLNSLNLSVGGDWTNNGGSLTTTPTGTVIFNGTNAQTIAGTSGITFNNLTIDNTAGVSTPNNLLTTVSGILLINNGKQLIVPSQSKLTATSVTNNAGSSGLVLKSDASGTATFINAGIVNTSVPATVQQYLTSGRDWYVGSPVSGATSAAINTGGSNQMATFNETTAQYEFIKDNSTTLSTGKGYIAHVVNGTTLYSFTGTLNDGDITLSPTRTGTTAAKRGFNLVANPYPSYLDWNAVTKTNMLGTIWYRTVNSSGTMVFDTYNGLEGTGLGINGVVNQYIPPVQSFWVRVNADNVTGSLVMTNTMRSHKDQTQAQNHLRVPVAENSIQKIRLRVSNGVNADETVLLASPLTIDGIDSYDAQKMPNQNTNIPEIYTLCDNQELVINCVAGFTADKEFALGFRPGKASDFSIEASEISGLNLPVVLVDKLNGVEKQLSVGEAYTFSSSASETTERFAIRFKTTSVTTGAEKEMSPSDISIYGQEGKMIIDTKSTPMDGIQVSIFNTLGQKLLEKTLTNSRTELTGFNVGIYLAKILVGSREFTTKIIIK
jgi:hypothetical protein